MKKQKFISFFVILCLIYPIFTFQAAAVDTPKPTAKQALLFNVDTGRIVFSKNEREKTYPASTAKMMTALIALEKVNDPDEMATVSSTALKGLKGVSTAGLVEGEQISVRNLLYFMLLSSASDAANVLAEHIGGSISGFVDLMNQKAKSLGMSDTNYTNPTGLHDDAQSTTAYDVLQLARACFQNSTFMEISSTTQTSIPPTNKRSADKYIRTSNHLISSFYVKDYYYEPAAGMNSGSTSKAGYCCVSSAKKGGLTYIVVVMGTSREGNINHSFLDAKNLFKWAFDSFELKTLITADEPIKELKVNSAKGLDYVILMPMTDISVLLPKDTDEAKITRTIDAPDSIDAPVSKGQRIGSISLSLDGVEYGRVDLISSESVERSLLLYILNQFKSFTTSTAFRIILAIIVLLIIAYVVFILSHNRRRKKKRYVRRKNNF